MGESATTIRHEVGESPIRDKGLWECGEEERKPRDRAKQGRKDRDARQTARSTYRWPLLKGGKGRSFYVESHETVKCNGRSLKAASFLGVRAREGIPSQSESGRDLILW